MKGLALLVTLVAGTLLFTGCGKDQPQSYTTIPDVGLGPLDQHLGVIFQGHKQTQAEEEQQELKFEELVAKCMTDLGFEYIPAVGNNRTVCFHGESLTDGPPTGSLEYAERYGYGVVEQPPASPGCHMTRHKNPNDSYKRSLTPEQREKYSVSLNGDPSTLEHRVDDRGQISTQPSRNQRGCVGWADEQIKQSSPQVFWEDPDFEDLAAGIRAVGDQLSSDPRTKDLNSQWSACMARAGHPGIDSPLGARTFVLGVYKSTFADFDGTGSPAWKKALTKFHKFEVSVATSEWTCTKEVDYPARLHRIDVELQQDFLDRNRAALDRAIAKYGNG